MPGGDDFPFGGDGGSFFPQCGVCAINCVRTDGKLLCAIYFVVDILLVHAVVYILLAHRSEVLVTRESRKNIFLSIEGWTYHVDFSVWCLLSRR